MLGLEIITDVWVRYERYMEQSLKKHTDAKHADIEKSNTNT